ncbi:MAG: 4-hydroxythreonine-4-phosphate dehydrogenase PdxA [Prevotellaceae bacterium]|jgi:4-hydroxythreonine-4-phosphate dehydrogenase|nr:4-hydroxythreonine-4-phosphate dehydrogenase PdxA [Prevotellaceae bacterium]
MRDKIRVGITHGDFNGISYEIIMKTFSDTALTDFFTPIVYGSSKAAAYYRKTLNMENFNFNIITAAEEANPKKTNIINVSDNVKVEMGTSSQLAGISSVKALDTATADLQEGKIDVIVTCPINKFNSHSESHNFTGHTEYFANKFEVQDYAMLMVSDLMKIGFVTGHIPITDIAKTLNKDLIIQKLTIINNCLKNDFLIRAPRIAVLSLNPHSGDRGLLGSEELNIICPAIDEARQNEILAFGTYSADGFFASGAFTQFDAILAMYHDQGMIPFKAIGLPGGVNYTAGLPIIRTSPAHGTAYDITGKGVALPASLRDAIFLASEIYANRKLQNEITANPLQIKTHHPKKILE